MNSFFEIVAGILRGAIKVALIALTALFLFGLLCVGVLIALVAIFRFLLSGRKPMVVTSFTRFNQAAQQFRPGGNWSASDRADGLDVVDVQAHEVRQVLAPLPPKTAE